MFREMSGDFVFIFLPPFIVINLNLCTLTSYVIELLKTVYLPNYESNFSILPLFTLNVIYLWLIHYIICEKHIFILFQWFKKEHDL